MYVLSFFSAIYTEILERVTLLKLNHVYKIDKYGLYVCCGTSILLKSDRCVLINKRYNDGDEW